MSAVVEAIGDAVSGVVDAVGDAVEWVGDTVGKVVDSVMDDPLKAVVQVAAVATGNAWALPIIEGVDVLEEGGSFEDALKGAATVYAVQTGVGFAMDSFGAAGATDMTGSGTTQFFDDGSSIQFFDDGSRLVTDTAGKVSSTPATDLVAETAGATTSPVAPQPDITATDLPPLEAAAPAATTEVAPTDISTQNVPLVEAPADVATKGALYPDIETFVNTTLPESTYNTMEELLLDKGLVTPEQLAATTPDPYANLPESFGDAVALDPNAPAVTPAGTKYDTMEDLMYDKGLITDAQYKDLTGVAPVVDLSKPGVPVKDVSVIDAAKDLGGAVIDVAKANPWTTAAVIGGGLAAAGALGGGGTNPAATSTPAQKTYTYGPGAPINRTGLQELYSAAANIYKPGQAGPAPMVVQAPQFQSNFQPLLVGQAPGGGNVGLGALGQGFSYTPMGRGQTFDISTLSPEQIVQMQEILARKKQTGEGT